MLAFLRLIRYQNLLMILLTMCLVRYALISSFTDFQLATTHFVFLALSVLCISAGGYIINDIYDLEADKINKPSKIYIGESFSIVKARFNYVLLNVLGLFFGIYISIKEESIEFSFFFIATAILLFLYSRFFKRIVLLGNVLISVLVGLPILLVYLFETIEISRHDSFLEVLANIFNNVDIYILVLYYTFFSFLTTLIREIIKDIEDINGDYCMQMKTLPILFGVKRARNMAIIFAIILIVSLILINNVFMRSDEQQLLGIYNYLFLVAPLLYFVYRLWNAEKKSHFSYQSSYMKWIMLSGILSMLVFKF